MQTTGLYVHVHTYMCIHAQTNIQYTYITPKLLLQSSIIIIFIKGLFIKGLLLKTTP